MGFANVEFNCSGVTAVEVFGQAAGVLLTNTLHGPLARGMVNCTTRPKPSACRSFVALVYSWSAIDR